MFYILFNNLFVKFVSTMSISMSKISKNQCCIQFFVVIRARNLPLGGAESAAGYCTFILRTFGVFYEK